MDLIQFLLYHVWTLFLTTSSATSHSFRKPNIKLPITAKTLFHPEVQCPSAHNRYLIQQHSGNCIVVSSFTVLSSRFAAHQWPYHKKLPVKLILLSFSLQVSTKLIQWENSIILLIIEITRLSKVNYCITLLEGNSQGKHVSKETSSGLQIIIMCFCKFIYAVHHMSYVKLKLLRGTTPLIVFLEIASPLSLDINLDASK